MKKLVFSLVLSAIASSSTFAAVIDCKLFDHGRAYWVDEDGTPHWRTYSFNSNCSDVAIQPMHGDKPEGGAHTDKINSTFICVKKSGTNCIFGFSWTLTADGKIVSKTESIEAAMGGDRLVKQSISRELALKPNGELGETIVTDIFYRDPGEDWFNVKTERSRCTLSMEPECQWNTDVRR